MPQKNAMTSIAQGSFDTSALNKELAMALEEDRKYKLTDSMKKRAIRTAANYDEFKNLVACADLKPVSQKDLNNIAKSDRKHNISYKKKESRKEFGANLHFDKAPSSIQEPPSTSVVFCRNWRRHLKSNQEKYRYLQLTGVERLGSIFKIDMDADLMAEILLVIVNMWEKKNIIVSETPEQEHTQEKEKGIEEKEEIFALKTLEALSSTRRFSLNLDFLDNNQLEVIQKVFRLIEDKARKNNDNGDDDDTLLSRLQLLKSTYKIL